MDEFTKKLEKVLGTIKEDRRPKLGIWYYLWKKPNWKLWHYEYTEDTKNISHLEAWQILAEELAEHYKITDEYKIQRLKEVYLCMPRGRIDSSVGLDLTPTVEWYGVFHGNDFPISQNAEIKRIIGMFDLTQLALGGKVKIQISEHEQMDPDHQKEAIEILGEEIPYG